MELSKFIYKFSYVFKNNLDYNTSRVSNDRSRGVIKKVTTARNFIKQFNLLKTSLSNDVIGLSSEESDFGPSRRKQCVYQVATNNFLIFLVLLI